MNVWTLRSLVQESGARELSQEMRGQFHGQIWRRTHNFPPISLFRVLEKIHREDCVIVLIAPFWPRLPWFQTLVSLRILDRPFLPAKTDLLQVEWGEARRCDFTMQSNSNWKLSRSAIGLGPIQKEFTEKAADTAARGRRNSTLRIYSSSIGHYTSNGEIATKSKSASQFFRRCKTIPEYI